MIHSAGSFLWSNQSQKVQGKDITTSEASGKAIKASGDSAMATEVSGDSGKEVEASKDSNQEVATKVRLQNKGQKRSFNKAFGQ